MLSTHPLLKKNVERETSVDEKNAIIFRRIYIGELTVLYHIRSKRGKSLERNCARFGKCIILLVRSSRGRVGFRTVGLDMFPSFFLPRISHGNIVP